MSSMIGSPVTRLDGPDNVTGRARYTADVPVRGVVYATFATSAIANGRLARIDATRAEQAPGVLKVFTHLNTPRLNLREVPVRPELLLESVR